MGKNFDEEHSGVARLNKMDANVVSSRAGHGQVGQTEHQSMSNFPANGDAVPKHPEPSPMDDFEAEGHARTDLHVTFLKFLELPTIPNFGLLNAALIDYQTAWMRGRRRVFG